MDQCVTTRKGKAHDKFGLGPTTKKLIQWPSAHAIQCALQISRMVTLRAPYGPGPGVHGVHSVVLHLTTDLLVGKTAAHVELLIGLQNLLLNLRKLLLRLLLQVLLRQNRILLK